MNAKKRAGYFEDLILLNGQLYERIKEKNGKKVQTLLLDIPEFIKKIENLVDKNIYMEYSDFFKSYMNFCQKCIDLSFIEANWNLLSETQALFFNCIELLYEIESDVDASSFNSSNKEEPLVSVIVPVYNVEDVISETLDNILGQTYQNLEILLINDASTDNTLDIISSYMDKRIKIITLEQNSHVCTASNIGFKNAVGKYIAYTCHDDTWCHDKIEKQVSFMEAHPSHGVCFTLANIVNENGYVINDEESFLHDRFSEGNDFHVNWIKKVFYNGNYFCSSSALIRNNLLKKTGYYRYALLQLQDYDLWLRLLSKAPIFIIQERLTNYRKFTNTNRNLSELTMNTQNRLHHETQWILDDFIENLSSEEFVKIFKTDLKNPLASSDKEVVCEKAFLLWKVHNCFAVKRFVELFEDEEYQKILREKYHFSVKDFYKLNEEPMLFDWSVLNELNLLKASMN